jgi:catechol-2,3-dioxygenase
MKAKFDHINLTVKNLAESMEWYKKAFDFEFLEGNIKHPQEPWAIIGKDDVMLCMYEDPALLPAMDCSEPKYHKVYHFGIRISDRSEWEKRAAENKFNVLYGGAYQYPRSVSWYVMDPSGHEIEVSYADDKPLAFT